MSDPASADLAAELPTAPAAGRWLIETQWLPDDAGGMSHVTTLYAVVPKHDGAARYRLCADGFRDPLHYCGWIEAEFDAGSAIAVPATWDDTRVLDRGASYWVSLSRAAGPASQAEAARDWLQSRFAGLCVRALPLGSRAGRT